MLIVKKDKESDVINLRSNYERDKDFENNFQILIIKNLQFKSDTVISQTSESL